MVCKSAIVAGALLVIAAAASPASAITVGPHSEVHGKNPEPGRLIWNIETTQVQAEFDRMKAAGAIVIREPYEFEGAPGSAIATFADPDGNYFQLTSPMGPPPEA